jgi:hypothetical protein
MLDKQRGTTAKSATLTHGNNPHYMILTLPAQLNPISRRKDRSVKLSYETRELTPSETMSLMALEGAEGWLVFAPTEQEATTQEIPDTKPELGQKTASERLRGIIYVHYKQAIEGGKYIGIADTFYQEQMAKIIEGYKLKNLHD